MKHLFLFGFAALVPLAVVSCGWVVFDPAAPPGLAAAGLGVNALALWLGFGRPVWRGPGRHFALSQGAGVPGLVRFFSQAVELADGARTSWVTVTRVGRFSDPRYGEFEITLAQLEQLVANFNARVLGQDVFLDVSHKPSDGAAGKFLKLAIEGGRLRALVEWTPFGIDAVRTRGFAYLSAEYHENWIDNERQQPHGCVLLGAGLTTRPVIKNLEPVLLSHEDGDHTPPARVAFSPSLLKELSEQPMKYLEQLKTKLLAMGLQGDVVTMLLAQAKAQFDAVASDAVKALALVDEWAKTGQAVADQMRAMGAGGGGQPVTITLAAPSMPVDVAGEVARALAARDAAEVGARTALTVKLKLLSDAIAEGDKTLTPEGVKKFADDFAPLVSAAMSDEQVKHLAGLAVKQAQQLSAAHKLVTLGYNAPSGSVHISVDSSNTIKSLQATIDQRMGFSGKPQHERTLTAQDGRQVSLSQYVERALEQFDARHGARLAREYQEVSGAAKLLAAGTGSVSDVAVPAIAERTVLREALYGLTSLNFVNVGTAPFAQVITMPYSYRDTSAAGVSALRRYEGQSIRKAGVIQTSEEARPIPQKLAFAVTSEMRMLMGASVIDFDPVTENIRNVIRIVGEDTEAINVNELVYAADEAGVSGTTTDTLTAHVNGTKSVFALSQFPVVRPRKVFDLKGNQVGSTSNAITVTLNSVARSEFTVNADGTALASGTYWIMDYNLGELRFVDQDGAAVVPTSGWALTVAYKYSTNALKWDTDAVSGEDVKDRYDRLLTGIGGRKAVISSDRFYNPNMVLMSATVDNAVSQARSFEANASRVATGLAADGSVGQIKGLSNYNTTAPGLVLGDTRILVGERGNTRFRMVKPFSMNPLEQARDGSGNYIDTQDGFGTQWVVSHTPTQLKNSLTSVVLYSATGRVSR